MTDQAIGEATRQIRLLNPDFLVVAAYSAIGLLVMLNAVLHFPELGALIVQFNQF
jgi:hypothetical protein